MRSQKLQRATVGFILSVHLSVCVEQISS